MTAAEFDELCQLKPDRFKRNSQGRAMFKTDQGIWYTNWGQSFSKEFEVLIGGWVRGLPVLRAKAGHMKIPLNDANLVSFLQNPRWKLTAKGIQVDLEAEKA